MASSGPCCVAPDRRGNGARHVTRPPEEKRLGKLVPFTKRGRNARARTQPAEPGEVVLFTGVRYERSGAPMLPDKPAGAASGGKRRRG